MLWKVEGLKMRGATRGLSYQDDNRSVFSGFVSWNIICQKASKYCKLQDFVLSYNAHTADVERSWSFKKASIICQKASKYCKLQDFVLSYNARTADIEPVLVFQKGVEISN